MNIAFYVSGKAERLKKIIEENLELLSDVKLIFSDDAETLYLESLLLEKGLEYRLFDYKKIEKSLNRNLEISNMLVREMQLKEIDYCFCFGRHLLTGEILIAYENRIINFHPSILPLFPGVDSIDRAIEAGMKVLGNTAHFIDQGMDTGPIIMQNFMSVEVFYEKGYAGILDSQIIMLKKIYEWLKKDQLTLVGREVIVEESDCYEAAYFSVL